MPSWNSRGLRGSVLENIINMTNEKYRKNQLALVQKVPTPITPVQINEKGQITLAYFDSKSTVDYIGAVQGVPICFDAKECAKNTFPLQNIHEHQIEFMEDFESQGGISFLILYFSHVEEYYYFPLREIKKFWTRAKNGGRKSIQKEELVEGYYLKGKSAVEIPYLEGIKQDLESRE